MRIMTGLFTQRGLWLAVTTVVLFALGLRPKKLLFRPTWFRTAGLPGGPWFFFGTFARGVLDQIGAIKLARTATACDEPLERGYEAKIATLEAQIQRYQAVVDNFSQGFCLFDAENRLILSNRSFAEIYRISPDQVQPGVTSRKMHELRLAAGTLPRATEDFLESPAMNDADGVTATRMYGLMDGRTIQVSQQPLPNGDWVEIHDDFSKPTVTAATPNERISLQAMIDRVPDYLWVKDTESRFLIANKVHASDLGLAEACDLIGLNDFDLHAPELAQAFRASEQALLCSGQPMIDKEEFIVNTSGGRKWLLTTKVPLRNDQNEIIGLIGISRDITERKRSDVLRDGQAQILEAMAMNAPLEKVLEQLMHLVESQLTGIHGCVLLLDETGTHLRYGVAPSLPVAYARAIDGVRIGPKVGSCGTAAHRCEAVMVPEIANDPLWEESSELAAAHGYRSCWSTPIVSHQGKVLGTFALYSKEVREPNKAELRLIDMSVRMAGISIERKQSEDRIHFMANHDALTGLPNRTLLRDRLSQAIFYAQRYDRWVTVLFIDLDNFKFVNDSLGHNAGDELLKQIANRMVDNVRATDTVVRLGGDEFVIVLFDQHKNVELTTTTLRKIRAAIAEPISLEGHRFTATCSIGIASYPNDGMYADTLLAHADAAMYRAKELGRDNFQFYTPQLNTKVHEKFLLQAELRNAIAKSEFVLLYQPQVDLRTGRIFAVEALIRWKHPIRGMVTPMKFIPMAEESGLIVPIGDWVLHEACRQNKAWQDAGLPHLNVSVNISARQFREKDLLPRVVRALENSGLEARYLELELTESLIMQDIDRAVATMKALQALGVQLSIDDFGTGYSSLSALKTFPVARLKIDKSFIIDLANNENDKAVASAVISLGQKLNLRIIAEGVETDEQIAFLRENNCDEMQGYHFSKPIAAWAIEELLTARCNP